MQHPHQKYIDALVKNDPALLEELYQKYSGKIKLMVLQNSGSETDAADIFQEVLLWIYKKATNQNFTLTCPLDAFLYVACKNKWMSELNKRKLNRVTINDFGGYSINEDWFQVAEEFKLQQERKDLLTEKLGELREDCRELLQLSWSNKSMEDVAGILKIT